MSKLLPKEKLDTFLQKLDTIKEDKFYERELFDQFAFVKWLIEIYFKARYTQPEQFKLDWNDLFTWKRELKNRYIELKKHYECPIFKYCYLEAKPDTN